MQISEITGMVIRDFFVPAGQHFQHFKACLNNTATRENDFRGAS